jgi:hypothetical protein
MLTKPKARVIAHQICARIIEREMNGGMEILEDMSDEDAESVREEIRKIIDGLAPLTVDIEQLKKSKK